MARLPLKRSVQRIVHELAMLRWRLGIETAHGRERRRRFDSALADLSETHCVIFLMARRDNLSLDEIARRLGMVMREVQAGFAHALEQIDRALRD
jgi:DNA-directed RNA polymerase specialized sigma24 family protein